MAEVVRGYYRYDATPRVLCRVRRAKTREVSGDSVSWQPHAVFSRPRPHDVAQIGTQYEAGDGCTVLSRRWTLSENAVLALLRSQSVTLRPAGKVTAEDVVQMRRLRERGWTYRAIGEKYMITRMAVSRRLRRS